MPAPCLTVTVKGWVLICDFNVFEACKKCRTALSSWLCAGCVRVVSNAPPPAASCITHGPAEADSHLAIHQKHSHTSLPLSYTIRRVLYSKVLVLLLHSKNVSIMGRTGSCTPCAYERGNAAHTKRRQLNEKHQPMPDGCMMA